MKNGKYVIGLDAGHGGSDPGAPSVVSGVSESQLTLELALMVQERLEKQNRFEIVMTRTDDTSPGDASVRGAILGKAACDFALSIHFNAFSSGSANGTEIYVPSMEQYGDIEYHIMKGLSGLFKERNPVCKCRNYSNGNVSGKTINPTTYKFEELYNQRDWYGVIRNAWSYGVSCDLLEICFITNQSDYTNYVSNKSKVADIIAGGICKAYGIEYSYEEVPENPPVDNPNVGGFTEEEWRKMQNQIDRLTADNANLFEEVAILRANIKEAVEILNKG